MASSSGPYSTLTRRLYRDGLQTPWGFRLQGGKDFNQHLTVQRVFTGSPAEGELQRGDIITSINGQDVSNLVHTQAQDLITKSGGQMQLTIQRGQTRFSPQKTLQSSQQSSITPTGFRSVSFESNPAPKPFTPPPTSQRSGMNFGVDYTGRVGSPVRRPEQTMINRIQDSLDNINMIPRQEGEDMNYAYQTVGERKRLFANEPPKPVVRAPGVPGRSGKSWNPPMQTEKPKEFGWAPTKRIDPGYVPGPPMNEPRAYSPPRQAPHKPRYDAHMEYGGGSRTGGETGGPPAWKGTLRGPGTSGPVQAVPAPSGDGGKNVDFTKSYAYQMIQEQEAPGGGSRVTTETRHTERQSRSFRALEDEVGASDF